MLFASALAEGSVVCPDCRSPLKSEASQLVCTGCQKNFPVQDGIPRFVPVENYASNFGYQWNLHARTQLDKFNGTTISKDRFFTSTGWSPVEMKGRRVLECGSGAGRFSQVISDTGAELFTIDYSIAVEANAKNNSEKDNILYAQASLYDLPFKEEFFDYLICLGVLQHTPDIKKSVSAMFRHLKPGGSFCFDAYAWPISYLHPRHLLRPFTSKMPSEKLYRLVKKWVPRLLPISTALHKVPGIGQALARLVPVANWRHLKLADEKMYEEWALLDTFDWLSPTYEQPQSARSLRQAFEGLAVEGLEIIQSRGLLIVRGRRGA